MSALSLPVPTATCAPPTATCLGDILGELLTTRDAAQFIGVSAPTILRMKDRLHPINIGARMKLRWPRANLIRHLESLKPQTAANEVAY